MNTITAARTHAAPAPTAPLSGLSARAARVRNRISAVLATVAAMFAVPHAAFAAGAPASTTAGINDMFGDATTLIVTVLGVAAFTLTIAILGITLGMKWVKKVAKSS